VLQEQSFDPDSGRIFLIVRTVNRRRPWEIPLSSLMSANPGQE
jgi:hypothetical protein